MSTNIEQQLRAEVDSVWLLLATERQELAATRQKLLAALELAGYRKEKLEAADKVIRESQEQEPVCCIRASKEKGILWSEDCVAGDADRLLDGYEEEVAEWGYFAMPLYAKPVIIPQSVEQLHIKELRDVIQQMLDAQRLSTKYAPESVEQAEIQLERIRKAGKAAHDVLAKQLDTRALDKALLESEMGALKSVLDWADGLGLMWPKEHIQHMINGRLVKLNELKP